MGVGIAQMFAAAGHDVKIIYVYDDKTRSRPVETMTANLAILTEEGVLPQACMEQVLSRVSFTESLEEAADFAQVIIECIVENLAGLFSKTGSIVPPLYHLDNQHVGNQRDRDCGKVGS